MGHDADVTQQGRPEAVHQVRSGREALHQPARQTVDWVARLTRTREQPHKVYFVE